MGAIVTSYSIAQTTLSDNAEFAWFWLGMAAVELPLVVLIARRKTQQAVRGALLILFGIITFAPKLLRDPASPVFHDEFAHWRETYDILTTGRLFRPAPIVPIISRYPGLHSATAALVNVTGLSIWQAAALLLLLFHVALLLGIMDLAQLLGMSNRAAVLIAVLYSVNSSFLYFDTEFGYESMAITLLVWTLAAFARAIRSQPGRGRAAWCFITVFLSSGTVVTHHLSSINLSLIMALASLAHSVPQLARRPGWIGTAATAWGLTLFMVLAMVGWFHFVAPGTLAYLSPYLGTGFSQLMQVAMGNGSGRKLFAASLSPAWEHQAAYLVIVIALCMTVAGAVMLWARIKNGLLPRGSQRSIIVSFALLGMVYFPSTLFILSEAGAEGARRSWAITWIGLAILIGPAAVHLIDWAGRRVYLTARIGLRAVLMGALVVALIGGTAAGLDPSYRFPGPFLYGSDARSTTPELRASAQWFLARFGPDNNIVTERYTGLEFASFGLQLIANPSAGFPVYDLYLDKPGQPIGPGFLLRELSSSGYQYLIVDERMAYDTPNIGVYFEPDEPSSFILPDGQSAFKGRLNKFNTTSWLAKVFQSDDYSVYRINLPPAQGTHQRGEVNFQGKLTVGQ
jgi:hypothetical protein